MKDNYRMGSDTIQDDPGLPSVSGCLEISEDMAQALHRILNHLRGWRSHPMSLASFRAARNALWVWFREGRLRICREGNTDVLGIVEGYRLLRVPTRNGVRYAIETARGNRYFADDDDGPDAMCSEEDACHLNWHYLLFPEEDGEA